MDIDISLSNVDSLLTRFALQIRQVSQKKIEYNQQVEVFRTDIAGWKSRIESLKENIKKLEEEIKLKQSSVKHNKAVVQSLKVTNSRILQYEQTLKAELESRRTSYNDDTKVFEERITSYRKMYQSHKDYYCENPLAQKLLKLQAENEEIEGRIKACDEQIMMKQKDLDLLRSSAVTTSFIEKLPDSACDQQPTTKTQEQPWDQTGSGSIGQKISAESCAENTHNEQQETTTCSQGRQEQRGDARSHKQMAEHSSSDEMQVDEQEKETQSQDKILEQQPIVSEVEEAAEVRGEALTSNQQENEGPSQSSVTVASTPTFSFTFSPVSSPHSESSETKPASASLFFMNSTPSTPCFSGFGFDTNSLQEEEQGASFAFTSSLFDKKDTTEKKPLSETEFLFGQSEQSEDFQFAFNFQSPEETSKDKNKEDFVFPFNF